MVVGMFGWNGVGVEVIGGNDVNGRGSEDV